MKRRRETDPADAIPKMLEGIELHGALNVSEDQLIPNVQYACGLGLPQIHQMPPQPQQVCLVAGGPSLVDTADTLRDLVYDGAFLVTMNGSYHWCLERGWQPHAQIVLDARPSNARFVQPVVPRCRYYLASQCAPETFHAVVGKTDLVGVFHAAGNESPVTDVLKRHYLGSYALIGGGTTVLTRAIFLLRMLGYLRFHIFGADSCWRGNMHHAFAQKENARDRTLAVKAHPSGRPDLARVFRCAPWHLKQVQDVLQMLRVNGQHFLLKFYGDGLLSYLMNSFEQMALEEADPDGSAAVQRRSARAYPVAVPAVRQVRRRSQKQHPAAAVGRPARRARAKKDVAREARTVSRRARRVLRQGARSRNRASRQRRRS